MPDSNKKHVELPRLCSGDDFTIYKAACDFGQEAIFQNQETKDECAQRKSFSGQLTLHGGPKSRTGRALACPCFRGAYVSITLRTDDMAERSEHGVVNSSKPTQWTRSSFEAEKGLREGYDLIFEQLLKNKLNDEPKSAPQGIIIVAGGTGSGKTTVVRGIIDLYLQQLVRSKPLRRPHFVTYEDPIEALMFPSPLDALYSGIDYTPREKGKDAVGLKGALSDALRQTPSLFYIGEVRDDEEWEPIINFAGTGHLVIATTHAGSVTECMKKVFRALKVTTAADRNHVAEKIVGVVHLYPYRPPQFTDMRLMEIDQKKLPKKWVLPSLWRGTSHGVSGLVSDGLASILPYNPSASHHQYSSIGRRWFARELLRRVEADKQFKAVRLADGTDPALYDRIYEDLDRKAVELDMKGM